MRNPTPTPQQAFANSGVTGVAECRVDFLYSRDFVDRLRSAADSGVLRSQRAFHVANCEKLRQRARLIAINPALVGAAPAPSCDAANKLDVPPVRQRGKGTKDDPTHFACSAVNGDVSGIWQAWLGRVNGRKNFPKKHRRTPSAGRSGTHGHDTCLNNLAFGNCAGRSTSPNVVS